MATFDQGRKPPSFQEYAAAMMANINWRLMSLAERGLFQTMRYECWENGCVPADPAMLARIISQPEDEVRAALPAVMPFFESREGILTCTELEKYRAYRTAIREAQSAGGKASADSKKSTTKTPKPKGQKDSASNLQATSKSPASNLQVCRQEQTRPEQQSQNQSVEKGVDPEPWVSDYDEYEKASNGQ
jgi:uncharacterized protein YdaU (DUF1376 family)